MRNLTLITLASACLCAPATAQTITVQPGDTLSIIAAAQLGNVGRWRDICVVNRAVIGGDCNTIRPGMQLRLPGPNEVGLALPAAPAPDPTPEPEPAPQDTPAPVAEPVEETAQEPVAEAAPARQDIVPADLENGEVVYNFAAMEDVIFNASAPYSAGRTDQSDYVSLAGNAADAPSDGQPGIWLQLDEAFEQAAIGRSVQIDALVRLSSPGTFAMSYSTGDVDSGWQTLSVDEAFGTISFQFDIPDGPGTPGDFLGVLPDPDNTGQTLDISFLAVTIIE